MKRSISLLTIFFLISLMSGCTRYYKTKDLKKYFGKGVKQSSKVVKKTESDYEKNKKIYDSILSHIYNKNMKPYPLLKMHLSDMNDAIDKLKERHLKFVDLKKEFSTRFRGKKKIQSGKPEWGKFNKLNEDFEKNIDLLKIEAQAYQKASKAFAKTAKNHKIWKVNTKKIKKKIKKATSKLAKMINKTRKKIKGANKKLDKAKRKGHHPAEIKEKKSILNQMDDILKQIESKNGEITDLVNDFEKEAGERKVFWSGPGMTSHTILIDIQGKADEIRILGKKFDKLSKRYK